MRWIFLCLVLLSLELALAQPAKGKKKKAKKDGKPTGEFAKLPILENWCDRLELSTVGRAYFAQYCCFPDQLMVDLYCLDWVQYLAEIKKRPSIAEPRTLTLLRDKTMQGYCNDRRWDYCCKGMHRGNLGIEGFGIECLPSSEVKANREERERARSAHREHQGKSHGAESSDGQGGISSPHRPASQEKKRVPTPGIKIPVSPSPSIPFLPNVRQLTNTH